MFYRPHFCCHCGEKIVRARWTPLTSRRFCEFCAVEQKQHDLLPRAATIAAILFGFAGLTAYLGGSGTARVTDTRTAVHKIKSETDKVSPDRSSANAKPGSLPGGTLPNTSPAISNLASSNTKQRAIDRNSSTDPVNYCGAMTKKGTACTRRVKTSGRCWQHAGQPAISSQN